MPYFPRSEEMRCEKRPLSFFSPCRKERQRRAWDCGLPLPVAEEGGTQSPQPRHLQAVAKQAFKWHCGKAEEERKGRFQVVYDPAPPVRGRLRLRSRRYLGGALRLYSSLLCRRGGYQPPLRHAWTAFHCTVHRNNSNFASDAFVLCPGQRQCAEGYASR